MADSRFVGVDIDNSEEEAYQKRLRECGLKCLPIPEIESVSRMGLVRFEFDKPMKVPDGYKHWKGNNTYLNNTEFGTWPLNLSIPIDVYVTPG